MRERLYYADSYVIDFTARVTGVECGEKDCRVSLDRTAFYPTSGGQLFDTGEISGHRVIGVIEDDGEVWHILKRRPDFAVGDSIEGRIDWERRRDNMQKHTGQHILSRAFIEICGAETVSAGLGEDDSTIEVNTGALGDAAVTRAEYLANEIIFENRPVTVDFVPDERLKDIPLRKIPDRTGESYRIVTIDGFDWSACGGTHCGATGGVGIIRIIGCEKVRGHLRFRFLTGLRALDDYRWRFEQVERVSNLLTRHGREAAAAVETLIEENVRLRRAYADLKRQSLPARIETWMGRAVTVGAYRVAAIDLSDEEFNEAREAALGIINEHNAIALVGVGDKIIAAVAKGLAVSASDIIKKAAAVYGGRGGGSPQLAQGGGFSPDDVKVLLARPETVIDI